MSALILFLGIGCCFSAGMLLNQMLMIKPNTFQKILFAVDVLLGLYLIVSAIGMIAPTI